MQAVFLKIFRVFFRACLCPVFSLIFHCFFGCDFRGNVLHLYKRYVLGISLIRPDFTEYKKEYVVVRNRSNKNRFDHDSKYFTICVYAIITVAISAVIVKMIFSWDIVRTGFNAAIRAIWPFLVGFLLAYFLNPLVQRLDRYFLGRVLKVKSKKVRLLVSLLISYLLFFGAIVIILVFLIPQVGQSISDLMNRAQSWPDQIDKWLLGLQDRFPAIDFTKIRAQVSDALPGVLKDFQENVFTKEFLMRVFSSLISAVSFIFNVFIAIIVSIYMIVDRYRLGRASSRLIRAIFREKHANSIISTLNTCNHVFSRFLVGKTIDSIIIGILCFIAMAILQLPYALVISIIVGITNMIPYFGPFIGAIPGGLIILMTDPYKVIIYLILILVLQQFDGLYLGPKILGDSTGLRPLWIIFAITIGGSIAGWIGMFLGVPVVAVLSYLLDDWVRHRLKERNISYEEAALLPAVGGMEGSDALQTHDHVALPKGLDEMPGTFADGIDNIEYLEHPEEAPAPATESGPDGKTDTPEDLLSANVEPTLDVPNSKNEN